MALKIYIEDKDKRYAYTDAPYTSLWETRLWETQAEDFPNIASIKKDDIHLFQNNFNFEAKDITAEDLLDLKKAEAKITKQILDIFEPKIKAKGYYVDGTSLNRGELYIYVRKVKVETKEKEKQETTAEVKEVSRNNNNDAKTSINNNNDNAGVICAIILGLIFLVLFLKS